MKFYKILIVLLLIILTIGAVSAADNHTNDNLTVNEDLDLESSNDDITLMQIENDNNLTATPGTLTDLKGEIDAAGSELKLTRDYEYSDSESINVSVDNEITIDGQGHSIDCKKARSLFLINANNVVLKNIKFMNCKSDGTDGSAIYWNGNAGTLQNCSFENCTSSMETSETAPNGGAIYWNGESGRISNCSFEKCTAILSGGAVYWKGINGSVSDCSFVKCSAVASIETYTAGIPSEGGAVCWAGRYGFLSYCSFEGCSAADNGNAICWKSLDGTAIGCSFVKVSTNKYDVYWSGNNGNLTDSIFINCSSTVNSGGVLYWTGVNGSVADCGFVNITGCAVHLFGANGIICSSYFNNLKDSGIHVEGTNGSVINCSFDNCTSIDYGSAIYWKAANGSVRLCEFVNCSSSDYGGAIYWQANDGHINGSNFTDCSVTGSGYGGAIHFNGENTTIDYCYFKNCSSDKYGGAITVIGNNNSVQDSEFVKCFSSNDGGAIYMRGDNNEVNTSDFVNCSIDRYGGALYWNGINGTVINSTFANCCATAYDGTGGAILFVGKNGTVAACDFGNCSAGKEGGAISWGSNDGYVSNSTFNDCSAASRGGAVYWYDEALRGKIEYSNFTNSRAPSKRAVYSTAENVILASCRFEDNTTNDFSDLVSTANITNCVFNGELLKKDAELTITASDIIYGEDEIVNVTLPGDATGQVTLTLRNSNDKILMNSTAEPLNGLLSLNIPYLAAGAYIINATYTGDSNYNQANTTINFIVNKKTPILEITANYDDNLTVIVNLTAGSGIVTINVDGLSVKVVGIENGTGVLNVEGLTPGTHLITAGFSGNDNYLAAATNITITINPKDTFEYLQMLIDNAGDELTLTEDYKYTIGDPNIIKIDNAITINGNGHIIDGAGNASAFKLEDIGINLVNITFKNCKNETGDGGALDIFTTSCGITNCTFTNCSANNGGAIKLAYMDTSIINCVFINCFANQNGGAINSVEQGENINRCTFINCSANQDGGAIWWNGMIGTVSNSNFTNCSANNGGAFCNSGDELEISNSSFTKCHANTSGGAVYSNTYSTNCKITNSEFANNTAADGPAIYSTSDDLEIDSSDFIDKSATELSDVIHGGVATNCTLNGIGPKIIDLDITLLSNTTTCGVGDSFNLLVSVRNSGPSNATGAYVSLMLPLSLMMTSNNTTTGSYDGAVWTIGNLSANQTATLTITAHAIQTGNITINSTVTASESDANSANNMAQTTIAISEIIDLDITLLSNTATCGVGDSFNLLVSVHNSGPSNATGAYVSLMLPLSLMMTSNNTTTSSYDGAVWTIGNLSAGDTATLTITAHAIQTGNITINSTVTASESDANSLNNIAQTTIAVLGAQNTFEYLNTLIEAAGDTLTLTEDYYSTGNQIVISKSITIDGNGHTLNANGKSRTFVINTSGVTIKNTIFTNGHQDNTGSAIYWSGCTVNVLNCTFINNAANYDGGAIGWTSSPNSSVSNCTFINNTAQMGGGAIYSSWTNNWSISNCVFINSYARYDGGAIITWGDNNGLICNCTFEDNSAGRDGETVFWYNGNGNIDNSKFININKHGGKVIYSTNTNVIISNSNFEDETVENLNEIIYGGTVINCTLNSPSTKIDPSMTITTTDIHYGENATINISISNDATGSIIITVDNNEYELQIIDGKATLTINNLETGTYTAYATYPGDIKYLPTNTNTTFTVSSKGNKTFTDLKNLIDSASPEDTIELDDDYTNDGSITADGITISKAITIDGNGHTLDANNKSRIFRINADGVTLTNIVFENGNVGEYGGAIEWLGANGTLTKSSFINCFAIYKGSAIILNGTNMTIINSNSTNSFISNGSSISWGGNGTSFNSNSTNSSSSGYDVSVTISNSTDYSSSKRGGAIYWDGVGGRIIDCDFTICTSECGGGICVNSENINISGCVFEECSANIGGGIYWHGAAGNCQNSNFTNCTAKTEASAIYWNGTDGKIENSTFVIDDNDNSHAVYGAGNLKVSNSKFKASKRKTLNDAILGATVENCEVIGAPKTTPDMTVTVKDITYGEKLTVNVILPDDTENILDVNVFKGSALADWVQITPSAFSGNCTWAFSNLKIGEYTLNVEYRGDDNYERTVCNMTFTVRPKVAVAQIVPAGTNTNIYIDFGENITDTIIIKIDKKTFDVLNIKQGIVNATTKPMDFSTGNHTLTLAYEGDEFDDSLLNCNGNPIGYNIEIIPVEIPIEEEILTNDEGTFTVEIPINATGNMTIFINGTAVETIDVEKAIEKFLSETKQDVTSITFGILKIDLSKYKGIYTITFEYSGDRNYHSFTKEANITVTVKNPSITATPTAALYSAGTKFTIKVYSDTKVLAGKTKVVIKSNGKAFKTLYTTAGTTSFNIKQVPGTYKLTITALGKTVKKTLTVKHIVSLKKVTVKRSAKKLVLQATLSKVNKKYLKNKKITFKFNGKKYTAKTNKKGVAKVTIKANVLKKLKAGKKITYQATYSKDTVKNTVKVKK